MNLSRNITISAALTIIGFTLIWPVVLHIVLFIVIAIGERHPWSFLSIVDRLPRTFSESGWLLVLVGLAAGILLAAAGARFGKPPVWSILAIGAMLSLVPWMIMQTHPDEMGFRPLIALILGIAIGVGILIWGLLTRLLWKAKSI